jgi:hypothetical protein
MLVQHELSKKKSNILFDLRLKTNKHCRYLVSLWFPGNPKETDHICFSRWDLSLCNGFRS